MSFDVRWTVESEITFNENIEYLSKSWDLLTLNNFLDRVDEVIETISQNPNLYPVHRNKANIFRCVLNKHITLYYRLVGDSKIDLITFWNTHQDPNKQQL